MPAESCETSEGKTYHESSNRPPSSCQPIRRARESWMLSSNLTPTEKLFSSRRKLYGTYILLKEYFLPMLFSERHPYITLQVHLEHHLPLSHRQFTSVSETVSLYAIYESQALLLPPSSSPLELSRRDTKLWKPPGYYSNNVSASHTNGRRFATCPGARSLICRPVVHHDG